MILLIFYLVIFTQSISCNFHGNQLQISSDELRGSMLNHIFEYMSLKRTPQDLCHLSDHLIKEIHTYEPIVNKIINSVLHGQFKSVVYNELAKFVDRFGPRLSGTESLELSLDYLKDLLKQHKLENIHFEEVKVPHWVRGNESAKMILPRSMKIDILGLGGSVGTPRDGITAPVLVVKSFYELTAKAHMAKGRIVVFNQDFVSYGETAVYRSRGASAAAKVGAVAVLIRSITPFSLASPHTGQQNYEEGINRIPAACITVEVAEMLWRMSNRGTKIVLSLFMDAKTLQDQLSHNLIGELKGSKEKEKVVLLSGHVDSWDVGQGALDDGAGMFVSWYSVAVLRALGLRPRRTIRAVLWTAEEQGLIGANQYVEAHKNEMKNFNLVMESDDGTFTPEGVQFKGSQLAGCIIKEIVGLMKLLNATTFKESTDVGSDIEKFGKYGIPAASVLNRNERYFWFHHTNADMMTVLNSSDLDKNVAIHAAFAYVVANLSKDIPGKHNFSP